MTCHEVPHIDHDPNPNPSVILASDFYEDTG